MDIDRLELVEDPDEIPGLSGDQDPRNPGVELEARVSNYASTTVVGPVHFLTKPSLSH